MLWTNFSIQNARSGATISIIQMYVQCMSGGSRKELDCEPYKQDFEARTYPQLVIIFFTLFSFLSYSNLLYLIQVTTAKHFVVRTARRLTHKASSSSSVVTSQLNL